MAGREVVGTFPPRGFDWVSVATLGSQRPLAFAVWSDGTVTPVVSAADQVTVVEPGVAWSLVRP